MLCRHEIVLFPNTARPKLSRGVSKSYILGIKIPTVVMYSEQTQKWRSLRLHEYNYRFHKISGTFWYCQKWEPKSLFYNYLEMDKNATNLN